MKKISENKLTSNELKALEKLRKNKEDMEILFTDANVDDLYPFTESDFLEAYRQREKYYKIDFKGKEISLSLLDETAMDIILDAIEEHKQPSEIVTLCDELIYAFDQKINKCQLEEKKNEFDYWHDLERIIKIKEYKMRVQAFEKFQDNERWAIIEEPFFHTNERLNSIIHKWFTPDFELSDAKLMIGIFLLKRDSFYLKKDLNNNYAIRTINNIDILESFIKNTERKSIVLYRTEKELIRLISELTSKEYLSSYVVGLDKKNGNYNFTKIRLCHFEEHFTKTKFKKNKLEERSGIVLNRDDLKEEFDKKFYKIKDDTLIEIEREIENTYFIWQMPENQLAYLFSELTDRKIIKGRRVDKEDEPGKPQSNTASNSNTADSEKKQILKGKEEIHVTWKSIANHFMIVKNGGLEIINNDQMNSQKDNAKSLIEQEKDEIDKILDEIFGPNLNEFDD